jgi:hypothetical protein
MEPEYGYIKDRTPCEITNKAKPFFVGGLVLTVVYVLAEVLGYL